MTFFNLDISLVCLYRALRPLRWTWCNERKYQDDYYMYLPENHQYILAVLWPDDRKYTELYCSGQNLYSEKTRNYHKNPKHLTTRKVCSNHPKIRTRWLYHRIMRPKGADGVANHVDPDQTSLLGAVWSGSTWFGQTCLPKPHYGKGH